jgi:hypothetical protein
MTEAVLNRNVARRQSGGSSSAPVALPPSAHPMLEISGAQRAWGGGTSRAHCILAETLRQRGNRDVTNRPFGIGFIFLVMTNTWAIGRASRRVHVLAKRQLLVVTLSRQTARIGLLIRVRLREIPNRPISTSHRLVSFNTSSAFSCGAPLRTWIWSKVAWPIDFSWPQSSQGTE